MFSRSSVMATPNPGSRSPVRIAGLIVMAATLSGCAGPERDRRDLETQGREVFSPVGSRRDVEDSVAWSIVIVAYRGPQRDARANADLMKVHTEGGLPRAYVEDRGDATVIAYGRYDSPDDPQAQQDLAFVRGLEIDGGRPFAGALITPPSAANVGTMPEYDLRNVKSRLGDWVTYTLQIGAYGRLDARASADELAEFRATAEEAVLQLRREGEQAFYYHGPTLSMVLIGAWGDRDFEASTTPLLPPRYEAPAIREAKRKFPYNLFNGQAMREPGSDKLQASGLVRVPDN